MGAYRKPLQEGHIADPSYPRFLDVGRRRGPSRPVGHVEHDGRQVADVNFVLVGGRREEVADKHGDAVNGASAERIVQRSGLVRDPPGSRQRRLEWRPDGEVQVCTNARQHAAGAGEGDESDRSRRQKQDRGQENQGRCGERGPDVAHRPRYGGCHRALAEPIQQTAHGALQFAQRRQRPSSPGATDVPAGSGTPRSATRPGRRSGRAATPSGPGSSPPRTAAAGRPWRW